MTDCQFTLKGHGWAYQDYVQHGEKLLTEAGLGIPRSREAIIDEAVRLEGELLKWIRQRNMTQRSIPLNLLPIGESLRRIRFYFRSTKHWHE